MANYFPFTVLKVFHVHRSHLLLIGYKIGKIQYKHSIVIHNSFKRTRISIFFSDGRGCICSSTTVCLFNEWPTVIYLNFTGTMQLIPFHPCVPPTLWYRLCPVYQRRCIIFSNYMDAVLVLNMFFSWAFFVTTFISTMKLLNVAGMHAIHQLKRLLNKRTTF